MYIYNYIMINFRRRKPMGKLQTLEELRTKDEVLNYFKQLGKEIT